MIPRMPRILLSAYQCAPGAGSVSQIGWEWYSRLARRARVTLVTHVRNKPLLESASAELSGSEIVYIDTEWFARRLYAVARRLFPRSEHSVFLLSSLDYFVYDQAVVRTLAPRRAEWDVVHAVTPVSPSAHTRLAALGLPLVRGPLNGGLRTPPNFPEFMRADSAWLYSLRDGAKLLRSLRGSGSLPSATLVANDASLQALAARERSVALRMPEIAVDPELYAPAPWPEPPSQENPLRVLFVGRLIPAKALPLLLEAARNASLRNPMEVTVVGDGPMREAWQGLAATMPYRVQFLGACGAERVSQELSRSHVFCLPSVRESGGAVLLEAMSAARPVLAVNYGGPATLVNDRVGRLVPADSPASVINGMTEAFLDVIQRPGEWLARGQEGRKHVLSNHTWERRIEAGLALYSKLINAGAVREAA